MALAVNAGDEERSSGPVRLDQVRIYFSDETDVSSSRLGAGYQATVKLYETPLGNYVVKTARGPFLWRRLGEIALRREHAIYERLRDVQGVPYCLGLLDNKHLVLEHIPGDSYRQLQDMLDDRELFFDRFLKTIKEMHAAGVAHGDLKRKDNFLVGPDERPFVIDFGLARIRPDPGRRMSRMLFEWVKQYDYNAWIKHKYLTRVDNIAPEDSGYYRPMKLERIARGIRVFWQKITLRRLRRRHR